MDLTGTKKLNVITVPPVLFSLSSPLSGDRTIKSPKSTTYNLLDFSKPVDKYLPTSNLENFDLVIDTRPFNNYLECHLKNAVNICIPTTLIKRNSMTVHSVINLVTIPQHYKELLTEKLNIKNPKPQDKINLLFYDEKSNSNSISLTLFQTIGKFLKFDQYFNIGFLDGGFSGACRELLSNTDNENDKSNDNANATNKTKDYPSLPQSITLLFPSNECNHHTDNGLSGFILPSATNNNTKFVNDIKKNTLINKSQETCNYKHHFKLPNINMEKTDAIPNWLKSIILHKSNEAIISYMNYQFNKVELLEQSRLSSLISKSGKKADTPNGKPCKPHNIKHSENSPTICSPNGLCPDCDTINYEIPRGIEFGYKNRYKNIWPYEHSRVKLTCESCNPKDEGDDYFNANFVNPQPVVASRFKYIATQNPLNDTIKDFWKTVNTQNVKIIVNLDCSNTNYLNDTEPENNPFILKVETLSSDSSLIIRRINFDIYHFQYLKWPDFGVPENFDSLLQLINTKNEIFSGFDDKENQNTILVHCLAGCGRTGVFVALDSLIDCLQVDRDLIMKSDSDLIYKLVQHQRTQRISMIQNLQQYIVVYEIFLQYLANKNSVHNQASNPISSPVSGEKSNQISNKMNIDNQGGFFFH